jgi:alkylation response protein AidB-like acyl-CoA dehydrogenase
LVCKQRKGGILRDARAGTMNNVSDFADAYRPSEEHEAFRAAVRELCDDKVAPNAAEADELAEFPKASLEALVAADFHAPHIP